MYDYNRIRNNDDNNELIIIGIDMRNSLRQPSTLMDTIIIITSHVIKVFGVKINHGMSMSSRDTEL